MHIGILLTGHAPDAIRATIGDNDLMFRMLLDGHGFTFRTYAVVDNILPDSADQADGWLVTGSRHGAYEDLPWIPPLEDLIRAADQSKTPMVGACFGHQIIAKALGGHVAKADHGWIAGHQTYDYGDVQIPLHAWHQDQVITPPSGAKTLARGPGCPHAALSVGDHILTLQAHPEYDTPFLTALLEHRGDMLPPDRRAMAAASLGPAVDQAAIAMRFARVFKGQPDG